MSVMVSQITSLKSVYSTVYSGADQWKHQRSASRAFVREFTGEFPTQRASNVENVSIWWRHHGLAGFEHNYNGFTLAWILPIQVSFWICAQPMRDDVTLQRRLSLAGYIRKMIPASINFVICRMYIFGHGPKRKNRLWAESKGTTPKTLFQTWWYDHSADPGIFHQ